MQRETAEFRGEAQNSAGIECSGAFTTGCSRLRRILEGQQRVTATFRRPDGRALHVRTTTQAEPEQRAIFDALGIDPQPGRVRKTII